MTWEWTEQRERAADLLAEGRPMRVTADEVGCSIGTIANWKKQPEFMARVRKTLMAPRISNRIERLNGYQRLWELTWQIVNERSRAMAHVPGGDTGLLVERVKVAGKAFMPEYAYDRDLVSEIRALGELVARETGQWTERQEVSGPDGGPVQIAPAVDLSRLDDAELAALEALSAKALPEPDTPAAD